MEEIFITTKQMDDVCRSAEEYRGRKIREKFQMNVDRRLLILEHIELINGLCWFQTHDPSPNRSCQQLLENLCFSDLLDIYSQLKSSIVHLIHRSHRHLAETERAYCWLRRKRDVFFFLNENFPVNREAGRVELLFCISAA